MASSYLRKKRAADRKKKQKKLEKYVRKEAARALRADKAYRPKGKNAEERTTMVAVAKEAHKQYMRSWVKQHRRLGGRI